MKLLSKFMLLAVLLTAGVSCSDDDDVAPPPPLTPNLIEAAEAAGLTTLLDAIGAVEGLDQALLDAQAITVFAPTNDAFADALAAFGVSDLNGLVEAIGGVQNLETVLGFHVVPAVAFSGDLAEGDQTFTTLSGQDLVVTRTGSAVTVTDAAGNTSSVTTADVEIQNGVVHVIDGVLLPTLPENLPNLVEAAEAAGLTTLLDAVGAVDGLGEALLGQEAITVFAPTNDAFANALAAYGVDNLNDLVTELGGVENLETVLGFHVVPAVAFAGDLAEGDQTFTTLAEQDITVNRTGSDVTVTDATGATYSVTTADVEIENGVVHVIDGVLLPEITYPTVVEAAEAAGLTTLLAAIGAIDGLDQTLLDAEAITVFAPTNQAFVDLLEAQNVTSLEELVAAIGADGVADVLSFHVVPAVAFSHDLTDGATFETLQGESLTVNVSDNGVTVTDVNENTFTVSPANVVIDNGVVHVIDGVLLPTL